MKAAALQLRIGRVVWHGPGAPDARSLETAIAAALARALAQQEAPAADSAPARAGNAIAGRLLPRLPDGAR